VQRSDDARGENLIVCPPPNSSIGECKKYWRSESTFPDLCHAQKDCATKTSLQVQIKKRKKLYKSRAMLRNNNNGLELVKRTCKVTEFYNSAFGEKKSEVHFRKNADALLKKINTF